MCTRSSVTMFLYLHGAFHGPVLFRAAVDAMRKEKLGFFAGFGKMMDEMMQQMNDTVGGLPEDLLKVRSGGTDWFRVIWWALAVCSWQFLF